MSLKWGFRNALPLESDLYPELSCCENHTDISGVSYDFVKEILDCL